MELEMNLNFELSKIMENGKQLKYVYGKEL